MRVVEFAGVGHAPALMNSAQIAAVADFQRAPDTAFDQAEPPAR